MHSHQRIDPVSGTAWAAHAAGDSRDARTVTPGRRRSQHQPAFTDRSRPPLLALGAVPSHADMGLSVLRPGEPEALVEAPCRHVYPEHAKLDGHTTFGRFRLKLAHESGTDSAALKRRQQRNVALIGSSLGGFLATCIAEQIDCRACLINPAVAPHKVLDKYLGRYYHPVLQQHFDVTSAQMSQLQQMMPMALQKPENYLLLLQSGDEVLDYRLALEYYKGATIKLSEGGDHSYVGYASELEAIANFCRLA